MGRPSKIKAYALNVGLVDVFPFPIFKSTAPTTSDKVFEIGQLWIYKNGDTRTVYIFGGLDSSGNAVWSVSASGSGDLETLEGDSGGAIDPTSENIVIAGGTNVTTVGSSVPGTITINLDDAIDLATQVTSPLYKGSPGGSLTISPDDGENVAIKLGDNAGATELAVQSLAGTDIMTVTTDDFTVTGVDISIADDASTGIVHVGGGAGEKSIQMGHGSAAHTVTIGGGNAGNILLRSSTSISIHAGEIDIIGNLTLANPSAHIIMQGGDPTDFIGQATLSSGTVTVANINITANDRIFLTRESINSSTGAGHLSYSINAGVGFTITAVSEADPTSTVTTDESTISYFIVRQE